jgi:hypothetical protein
LADKFTVPPLHIGPLLVGAATGVLFTVTEVVYTVDGAQPASVVPSLTVSEYTVVDVGVAVGFSVVEPVSDDPVHTYVLAPPDGLADSDTVPPTQM